MPFEYKPRSKYAPAFNPEKCKASVSRGRAHLSQCQRKPWKDGWCKQHHPDTIAEKEAKREAEYQRERESWREECRQQREHNRRVLAMSRACSGFTTEQIEAVGEGGMQRLVNVMRLVRDAFEKNWAIDWGELDAALVPFEAGVDIANVPHVNKPLRGIWMLDRDDDGLILLTAPNDVTLVIDDDIAEMVGRMLLDEVEEER